MKISIVTVNLNNKDGLKKTIKSVLSQSWKDLQLIIIDGDSTDGSKDIIKEYQDHCTWISEPDNGIYQAMNKGISLASGEYLLFLNSGDTFYRDDTIESTIPDLNHEDIIYGNAWFIKGNKQWEEKYPSEISFLFFYSFTLNHQSSFIKKDLFLKYGLYREDIKINADWEFFIRVIFKHNVSYKHIDKIIAVFVHDGLSSKKESIPLIKHERKTILESEFPLYTPDYEILSKLVYNRRACQFLHIRQHKIAFRLLKWVMSVLLLFLPKRNKEKYQLPQV